MLTLDNSLVPLLGGALVGLAGVLLLFTDGRISGISGIFGTALTTRAGSGWRWAFVAGLVGGGAVVLAMAPEQFTNTLDLSLPMVVAGGLLVGFGTRLGSGCTSGHGICGLSRMSRRSFVAVATFMAAGALMATLVH